MCKRDAHLLEEIEAQNRALEAIGTSLKAQPNAIVFCANCVVQCFALVRRGIESNTRALIQVQNEVTNMRLSKALDPNKDSDLIVENALGMISDIPWDLIRTWQVRVLSARNAA